MNSQQPNIPPSMVLGDNVFIVEHKKLGKSKIAAIVIAAVVALAALFVGVFFAIIQSGNANLHPVPSEAKSEGVAYDEGKTVWYKGNKYVYNDAITSICIIGYDRKAKDAAAGHEGQADAVLVMALDTNTGKTTAISIPRDSMVEVGEFVGDSFQGLTEMQLCLAYSYGTSDEISSQLVTTIVKRLLYNMPINYYYSIDFNNIGELTDAVGGVTLTPIQTLPGTDIKEGVPITLTGNNAFRYVQQRDIKELESPLDRQARQEQFLKAYAKQVLAAAKKNPALLMEIFDTYSKYTTTNLGLSEFAYLASSVLDHGISEIDTIRLQGEMTLGEDGYAEFWLDKTNVYQTVLDVYYSLVEEQPQSATGNED